MTIHSPIRFFTLLMTVILITFTARGDEPTQTVIDAKDTAAIKAAMGKQVIVSGHVWIAQWSGSGKVMNIEFAGAGEGGLVAVVFDKNRKKLDDAFSGDFGKAIQDKDVQLRGRVETSGSKSKQYAGRPQIVIYEPDQITIQEATTQPG